jgi:hypothetical protein
MEEKLFKTALEFIQKYSIISYVINVYPHAELYGPVRIRIQGHILENKKAMDSLDMAENKENEWFVFTENQIYLTLTKD